MFDNHDGVWSQDIAVGEVFQGRGNGITVVGRVQKRYVKFTDNPGYNSDLESTLTRQELQPR